MQRWNGNPTWFRITPPVPEELARREALRCLECGEVIPGARPRPFCLRHSAYPQRLIREREARERLARRHQRRRAGSGSSPVSGSAT